MSSRHLRKLRKQQELLNVQDDVGQDSDGGEYNIPIATNSRMNAFPGFAALGDVDDADEDDAQDLEDDVTLAEEPSKPETTTMTAGVKNKKSKKKKKKGKKSQPAPAAEPQAQLDGPDEIDRALQELNLSPSPGGPITTETHSDYSDHLAKLLRINSYHLKVMNEMRNVFGRETIQAAEAQDQSQAASRQLRRGEQTVDLETFLKVMPGQKPLQDVAIRRNPFIQGKPSWPQSSSPGLTMACEKDAKQGYVEFAFAHNGLYITLERQFFQYVQMMDPMRFVYFLPRYPYHVSTLIQVSRIAKQDQNSALSADLCERALFTFGRVSLSSFRKKLEEGKARMSFRRPENRQFWLAGYLYIKSLVPKGTYRTALEWTKLFLSISPSDEYSLINYTHVLAIRAYEAQWFVDLCGSELFTDPAWKSPMHDYVKQTVVLAELQLKDLEAAKAALIEGMKNVPWLYGALFSALNLDTPGSIWGIQAEDGSPEKLYTDLYLHMAKDLWNNPQAVSLLKEVAAVIQKPDVKSLPKAEDVTLSIARFVYLDNTPRLMGMLPPGMLSTSPNFDFDPLPPPKDENTFSNEVQQLPWGEPRDEGSTGEGEGEPPRETLVQRVLDLLWPIRMEGREHDGELTYEVWDDGDDMPSDYGEDEDYMGELEPHQGPRRAEVADADGDDDTDSLPSLEPNDG